ncbi:hypothetical protein [Tuwongella immobilis]|uniref:Uncharacterized protein n=1 Tax=Tuwongella immobilis TaxID=692036 RepID=A0A6C2YS11_9BACT|nr:hypothetical protein [Tuwongella immobilis]VIP03939.1 unnamed protein product [Tuwongella immobilis]VTS05245.1 unnamed protein product [Tuwongella immobilis]
MSRITAEYERELRKTEAATRLAAKGREMLQQREYERELQRSRIEERRALDRRHEWQFLWAAMDEQLGALNPWALDTVPPEFKSNPHWTFDLRPFGNASMRVTFHCPRTTGLWVLAQIGYPETVQQSGETLQFLDWKVLEGNELPIVLAILQEMEKRIAENEFGNTSDHA